jgi:hypothetical protein
MASRSGRPGFPSRCPARCCAAVEHAVLWGTLSPTLRSDPATLKAYFVSAFEALPKATVKFGIREGTPTYVKR